MGDLVDLRRQAQLNRVLELLVSGEATTIVQACEIAGIGRSVLYRALASGALDSQIAQLKHASTQRIASTLATELPEIIEQRVKEAKGSDGSLRDRNDLTRTLMIAWEKLAGGLPEQAPIPEDARGWLREHGGKFPPIVVKGNAIVNVGTPGYSPVQAEVIEVEAEEVSEG